LWRYPEFTFRKIILAQHKNYTVLIAFLEAVGISYFFLFIVKAGDIYSIELSRLIVSGLTMAILVFFPFLYIFSIVCYFVTRAAHTGATLKGFVSSTVYSLHPIALGAIILLPSEIAVFGPFLFSNNPSPSIINPLPFYSLSFLDLVFALAAIMFAGRLTKLLFGKRKLIVVFAGIFFIFLVASIEIGKQILMQH